VVTVHDLTAFLHPDTLPRLYAAYNRFMIKRAMRRADVILTVSESVKQEIADRFPTAAAKTRAVYPGHYHRVSDAAVADSYESPLLQGLQEKKFFLFVGTVEKRKNLGVLIEAYKQLCADHPSPAYALVIAGRDGFGAEMYHDMAKNEPVSGDIRFAGYVSAADRTKLYSEAAAFVFPSVYEGFGSPQTECMAFGLPLLASDIPTNREISHGYGRFFAPDDPKALSHELWRITQGDWDEAAAQKEAAAVLSRLTWQKSAEKTLQTYQNALKIRPR
jgi:alpha-1,3-rhamnosyl/mannosyltransferase